MLFHKTHMKILTPKRGSEIAEQLYEQAIAAGDVHLEDKHGFNARVVYLINYLEDHEFADWQAMPNPDDDLL